MKHNDHMLAALAQVYCAAYSADVSIPGGWVATKANPETFDCQGARREQAEHAMRHFAEFIGVYIDPQTETLEAIKRQKMAIDRWLRLKMGDLQ